MDFCVGSFGKWSDTFRAALLTLDCTPSAAQKSRVQLIKVKGKNKENFEVFLIDIMAK